MRGQINLLPAEYQKKPVANREQLMLAAGILCFLFYMVYYGLGVAGVERANLRQELSRVNNELAALTEATAKYEMKLAQEQVLSTNKQLAERLTNEIKPLSPVLSEFNRIVPAGLILRNSETGENSTLLLKGVTVSTGKVADLVDILNQSPYFDGAKVTNIQEEAGKASWTFEVTCTWNKGGGQ